MAGSHPSNQIEDNHQHQHQQGIMSIEGEMTESHQSNETDSEQQKGILSIITTTTTASVGDQWEVQYARFFNTPSLSSFSGAHHHPSLVPRINKFNGSWIASFTSLARLKLLTTIVDYPDTSLSIILTVTILDQIIIQKFTVQFLTVDETERFINFLKEIFGHESLNGSASSISKSKTSSQSEITSFIQAEARPAQDWDPSHRIASSDLNSQDVYRLIQDWSSIASSAETYIQQMHPNDNYDADQNSNPMESTFSQDVQGKLSAFPNSFTSLTMRCYLVDEHGTFLFFYLFPVVINITNHIPAHS